MTIKRVCVYGLWHLGSVTAACLAEHFDTVGCDPDLTTIEHLSKAEPPLAEPGLAELIHAGLSAGKLSFTRDVARALEDADVVWVTFDTPVDEDDHADVEFVARQIEALFPYLTDETLVLISSQVPVGFTARTEAAFRSAHPGSQVRFAYSPENLRLGKALDVFRQPECIVVGIKSQAEQHTLTSLLSPFCERLEWMSVESAEMTKDALNAFLATSVTFINELALLCEKVGADAKEVERGLRSEARIGPKAYLSPGEAFAGGTLARDLTFLTNLGEQTQVSTHLLASLRVSNNEHKSWDV